MHSPPMQSARMTANRATGECVCCPGRAVFLWTRGTAHPGAVRFLNASEGARQPGSVSDELCFALNVCIHQPSKNASRGFQPPMSTVGQQGGATAVVTGAPEAGFTPVTWLVTRAAGRPPIMTVVLPMTTAPVQAAPETRSPTTEAGIFPISTVGTPGPVMASPVTVRSPRRAAGNMLLSPGCPVSTDARSAEAAWAQANGRPSV